MRAPWLVWLLALCPLLACSKLIPDDGDSRDAGSGAGVGWPCEQLSACRSGLYCDSVSKTCQPGGTIIQGGSCLLSAECTKGNYCTQGGACAASGALPAGATCSSEADCASGLLCAQTGLTGVCQVPGTGDVGRGCQQTAECMAGMLCVRGQCNKGYLAAQPSLACSGVEGLKPVIDFHVPRATDPLGNLDFYQLPFPNDIRLKAGKVD